MDVLLSIGGLATAVQCSPALLRHLEREGVLPPALRLDGSNRCVYRAEDVDRVRLILAERRARRLPKAA